MFPSLTALAMLLSPEVVPPDIDWHLHVERLLLTAIAGLCATVGILFRVFLGQYRKTVGMVFKMGEMLGENTAVMNAIPEQLAKQGASIERALSGYERSAGSCALTRERFERIIADTSRE